MSLIFFLFLTLSVAAINSLHQGKNLASQQKLFSPKRHSNFEKTCKFLSYFLLAVVVIAGTLLIKTNFWLVVLALSLGIVPLINFIPITLANILIVVPVIWLSQRINGK